MLLPAWEKPQQRTEMLLPAVGGSREGGGEEGKRAAQDCWRSHPREEGRGQAP